MPPRGQGDGQPFGVDVAFGDPVIDEPELVTADDTLDFIGIAPPKLRLYPLETHIAEKLHAYTLPRNKPNSRVKDLPDLALLATVRAIDAAKLRRALGQTFTFRKTHGVPAKLPAPVGAWSGPYAAMAAADRLAWSTLEAVTAAASSFLDPVLGGNGEATWDPASWQWKR